MGVGVSKLQFPSLSNVSDRLAEKVPCLGRYKGPIPRNEEQRWRDEMLSIHEKIDRNERYEYRGRLSICQENAMQEVMGKFSTKLNPKSESLSIYNSKIIVLDEDGTFA